MKLSLRKCLIVLFGFMLVFQTALPYFEVANAVAENQSSFIGRIIEEKETVITPGVNEKKMHVVNNRGQQRFSMLSVDLKDSNLSIVSGVPNGSYPGLQTLTGQAEHVSKPGHVVVGGINADFFDTSTGDVMGLFIRDGEVLHTGSRPAFGITSEGQAIIGTQEMKHQVIINENALTLSGTNIDRGTNELVMYSPEYGESTTTNSNGTEVILENVDGDIEKFGIVTATVREVINGKGNTPLEKGMIVLSGDGTAKTFLVNHFREGDEVKISLGFNEPWNDVVEAVGGNLILVESGILAKLSESDFNNAIAPRTAVGIKEDGSIFFLVIDGRTPGYSEGVNIHELAEIMLDMGAVQAINLDGGGYRICW